jgi:hypothetical protein
MPKPSVILSQNWPEQSANEEVDAVAEIAGQIKEVEAEQKAAKP